MPRHPLDSSAASLRAPHPKGLPWLVGCLEAAGLGLLHPDSEPGTYGAAGFDSTKGTQVQVNVFTSYWLSEEAAMATLIPGFPGAPAQDDLEKFATSATPDMSSILRKAPSCGFLVKLSPDAKPPLDLERRDVWDGLANIWEPGEQKDLPTTRQRSAYWDPGSARVTWKDSRHAKRKAEDDPKAQVTILERVVLGGRAVRKLFLVDCLADPMQTARFCYIQATFLIDIDPAKGLVKPYQFRLSTAARPSVTHLVGSTFRGGSQAHHIRDLAAKQPGVVLPNASVMHARASRERNKQRADPSDLDSDPVARTGKGGRPSGWSFDTLVENVAYWSSEGVSLELAPRPETFGRQRQVGAWDSVKSLMKGPEHLEVDIRDDDAPEPPTPEDEQLLREWEEIASRNSAELREAMGEGDDYKIVIPQLPKKNAPCSRLFSYSSQSPSDVKALWLFKRSATGPDPSGANLMVKTAACLDSTVVPPYFSTALVAPDARFLVKKTGRPITIQLGILISSNISSKDTAFLLRKISDTIEGLGSDPVWSGLLVDGSRSQLAGIRSLAEYKNMAVSLCTRHFMGNLDHKLDSFGKNLSKLWRKPVKRWALGREIGDAGAREGGVIMMTEWELGEGGGLTRALADLVRLLTSLADEADLDPEEAATKARQLAAWLNKTHKLSFQLMSKTQRDGLMGSAAHYTLTTNTVESAQRKEHLTRGSAGGQVAALKVSLKIFRDQTNARLRALLNLPGELYVNPAFRDVPPVRLLETMDFEEVYELVSDIWAFPPKNLFSLIRPYDADFPLDILSNAQISKDQLSGLLEVGRRLSSAGNWDTKAVADGYTSTFLNNSTGSVNVIRVTGRKAAQPLSGLPRCQEYSCQKSADPLYCYLCPHVLSLQLQRPAEMQRTWAASLAQRLASNGDIIFNRHNRHNKVNKRRMVLEEQDGGLLHIAGHILHVETGADAEEEEPDVAQPPPELLGLAPEEAAQVLDALGPVVGGEEDAGGGLQREGGEEAEAEPQEPPAQPRPDQPQREGGEEEVEPQGRLHQAVVGGQAPPAQPRPDQLQREGGEEEVEPQDRLHQAVVGGQAPPAQPRPDQLQREGGEEEVEPQDRLHQDVVGGQAPPAQHRPDQLQREGGEEEVEPQGRLHQDDEDPQGRLHQAVVGGHAQPAEPGPDQLQREGGEEEVEPQGRLHQDDEEPEGLLDQADEHQDDEDPQGLLHQADEEPQGLLHQADEEPQGLLDQADEEPQGRPAPPRPQLQREDGEEDKGLQPQFRKPDKPGRFRDSVKLLKILSTLTPESRRIFVGNLPSPILDAPPSPADSSATEPSTSLVSTQEAGAAWEGVGGEEEEAGDGGEEAGDGGEGVGGEEEDEEDDQGDWGWSKDPWTARPFPTTAQLNLLNYFDPPQTVRASSREKKKRGYVEVSKQPFVLCKRGDYNVSDEWPTSHHLVFCHSCYNDFPKTCRIGSAKQLMVVTWQNVLADPGGSRSVKDVLRCYNGQGGDLRDTEPFAFGAHEDELARAGFVKSSTKVAVGYCASPFCLGRNERSFRQEKVVVGADGSSGLSKEQRHWISQMFHLTRPYPTLVKTLAQPKQKPSPKSKRTRLSSTNSQVDSEY